MNYKEYKGFQTINFNITHNFSLSKHYNTITNAKHVCMVILSLPSHISGIPISHKSISLLKTEEMP